MNATQMMLNPNELVIDMPIDESNVNLKMDSLQSSGMVQPVTVWLKDLRIIDGFHRTEAAKRLGWESISCNVIDCTEEAFWDARIQSAKQHHTIEEQRLESWMLEAWKATEWAEQEIGSAIWESIYLTADYKGKDKNIGIYKITTIKENALNESQLNLLIWLREKSAKWGIDTLALMKVITKITFSGDPYQFDFRDTWWNHLAQKYNLGYKDRLALASRHVAIMEHIPSYYRGIAVTPETAELWLQKAIDGVDANILEMEADRQKELDIKWEEDDRRQQQERREKIEEGERKEKKERAQWEQTPQGKKQQEKARLWTLRAGIDTAKNNIKSISHVVDKAPEASALLAELAQFLHDFIAEHLPQLETPEANPVALENAKLRKENETLRDRVASLERALQSKESASGLLANAVAWSSTDLESISSDSQL